MEEVADILKEKLADHRQNQRETHGRADDWICTNELGCVVSPESLGKAYAKIKQKHGLSFTLHGLRHTHATELGTPMFRSLSFPIVLVTQISLPLRISIHTRSRTRKIWQSM
jgi:predicted metallopeptidase